MSDTSEYSESGSPIYRHQPRQREFEPAIGDAEALERIDAHVETYVGPVATVFHEIISDLVHIDVHFVEADAERNFHTLVTSGMSDRPMNTPEGLEDCRYAELLICLPPSWPLTEEAFRDDANYWPIRWLKTLARLPHEYDTWLGEGHTVPNGDPPVPFAPNTRLCGIVLAFPTRFDEEFLQLKVNDEKTIHFFSVIPIYKEEMDFKLKYGADPLFELFESNGIDELLDINRKNVCKKRLGLF